MEQLKDLITMLQQLDEMCSMMELKYSDKLRRMVIKQVDMNLPHYFDLGEFDIMEETELTEPMETLGDDPNASV